MNEEVIMSNFLALTTIMAWPVIPLFWIPVHLAVKFFRRLGILTYLMPLFTWLPLAFFIYKNRTFFLQAKIALPLILNICGISLLIAGTLLHIWTMRLLGTWGIIGVPEISGSAGRKLTTEGPFSIVRHPTYLAHTLMFSGVFFITGSVTVGIITLIDFAVVNAFIIPLEEKELEQRFGETYILYKRKVTSRFFPKVYKP